MMTCPFCRPRPAVTGSGMMEQESPEVQVKLFWSLLLHARMPPRRRMDGHPETARRISAQMKTRNSVTSVRGRVCDDQI